MKSVLRQLIIFCVTCIASLHCYAWQTFPIIKYNVQIDSPVCIQKYRSKDDLVVKASNLHKQITYRPLPLNPMPVQIGNRKLWSWHGIMSRSDLNKQCELPYQPEYEYMSLLSIKHKPINLFTMCSLNVYGRGDITLKHMRDLLIAMEDDREKLNINTIRLRPTLGYVEGTGQWVMYEDYERSRVDNIFSKEMCENLHDLKMEAIFIKSLYRHYYKSHIIWMNHEKHNEN